MSASDRIVIDTTESFEHLPSAPIHEAVIGIGARVRSAWDEHEVQASLQAKLVGYAHMDSLRELEIKGEVVLGKEPVQSIRDKGWKGHRMRSEDEKYVAQFNRDGFIFSRLRPYENWSRFVAEAMRLWKVFREMAEPEVIGRVGLRYINRFLLTPGERDVGEYMKPAPQAPNGTVLEILSFVHHDLLSVPGHPYAVRIVRTIQESGNTDPLRCYAIIDIDASSQDALEPEDEALMRRLEDLRWLKNKVFFGSITNKALAVFKEASNADL